MSSKAKRSSGGPSFSPHSKNEIFENLVEFLKTKFVAGGDDHITKDSVVATVQRDFDNAASIALISRAVVSAFGKVVHNKGRPMKDRWTSLMERSREYTDVLDCAEPATRSIYTIKVNVSEDEVKLLAALRDKVSDRKYVVESLKAVTPDFIAICRDVTCDEVKKEMKKYASMESSMLRNSSAEHMETFSLQACYQEYEERLPILTKVVSSVCVRVEQGKCKTTDKVMPAVTTVIGKMLGIYSNKLSAQRSYYGLLLWEGGIKDIANNRLAKLYDTVTHQGLLGKKNELSDRYTEDLEKWKKEGKQYSITFDNVDMMTRPRRESASKGNKMIHMVQAIAIADRVQFSDTNTHPEIDIDMIEPKHLLPNTIDEQQARCMMIQEVLRIWSELPALNSLSFYDIPHKHAVELKRKSEMVNLGVLSKNENLAEDMLSCLQIYHDHVPVKDGKLEHMLCAGDYLTFERGQGVQSSQSDGFTSEERLEGLIMVMTDFHVQMNYLKLIYSILFQSDASNSAGTLNHAKTYLNSRNVVGDPTKRYYDCAALLDKLTRSYVILAAMQEFGLDSETSVPNQKPSDRQIRDAAEKLVNKFIKLSIPPLESKSSIKCRSCEKKYNTVHKLRLHHAKTHPTQEFHPGDLMTDHVHSYTSAVLSYGLMRLAHNFSIQTGNGEAIITLYK